MPGTKISFIPSPLGEKAFGTNILASQDCSSALMLMGTVTQGKAISISYTPGVDINRSVPEKPSSHVKVALLTKGPLTRSLRSK